MRKWPAEIDVREQTGSLGKPLVRNLRHGRTICEYRAKRVGDRRFLLFSALCGIAGAFTHLASAALFGLGHAYQGVLGVLQTFTVGLVLAAVAVWRGSIWPCILAHVGIDVFGLFLLRAVAPALREALPA